MDQSPNKRPYLKTQNTKRGALRGEVSSMKQVMQGDGQYLPVHR